MEGRGGEVGSGDVHELDGNSIVADCKPIMDSRVKRLHCITPIVNLPSVLKNGILSYDRAAKLHHRSVAMPQVQERRDIKIVPQGRRLHQYANLYFDARNPMLYKRLNEVGSLCVLAVSQNVFAIPDIVLTDCNAASDYARFLHPDHWELIDFNDVFAKDWRHDNIRRFYQHRSRKCAEVLVPQRVPADLLLGAYVVDEAARVLAQAQAPDLPLRIVPDMFFR